MAGTPRRAPDSGSASSGAPARSANAASELANRASRSERPATTTARGRWASCASSPSSSASGGVRCAAKRAIHGRPPGRPPSSAGSGSSSTSGSRSGEVQVHRAGPAVQRGPERAAGGLAQPAQALRRGRGVVHLEVPLGRRPVELDLVDRLPGADVAQLGRAVGGQHEQRHARLVRLDHRRRVVGGGGARRAGERHRQPARLRQPEREEAGTALVEVRGRADTRLARQREDQRGGARPRRGAGVPQPAARELVDERAQAEVGVARH